MLAVTKASAALSAASGNACDLLDRLGGDDMQRPVNHYFVNSCYGLVFSFTVKAGVGIGISSGTGFLISYEGHGSWSAPCFLKTTTGHAGAIFGWGKVGTVMAAASPAVVQEIGAGRFPVVGSDLSVQVWPVVKGTHDVTEALRQAWNITDLISVSSGAGLVVDFSLKGGTLKVDEKANADAYGRGVTAGAILRGDVAPPLEMSPLYSRLAAISGISPLGT